MDETSEAIAVPPEQEQSESRGDKRPGGDQPGRERCGSKEYSRPPAPELEGSSVRVNEMVMGPVITRTRGGIGDPEWVTGDELGEFVVWLSFESDAKGETFSLRKRRDLLAVRGD